jgi:hypothetical protein
MEFFDKLLAKKNMEEAVQHYMELFDANIDMYDDPLIMVTMIKDVVASTGMKQDHFVDYMYDLWKQKRGRA